MAIGLLGKKIGMTIIFNEEGLAVPVTVVQLGENIVTAKLNKDKNGYEAIQVGGFKVKEKSLNKCDLGHIKKSNSSPVKPLREFKVDNSNVFELGQKLDVSEHLKEGMLVDVSGTSIGKGFQGTIKRYNAGRGPMSHGSKFHRSMGSIGAGTTPGRVFRGLHMPGQMGNKRVSAVRLKLIQIDLEKQVLLVRGSVPGSKGGVVVVKPTNLKWN